MNGQPAYHHGLSDESSGSTALIPSADRSSFKVLRGGAYAKDAFNVYFEGSLVSSADAKYFEALSSDYGRDNYRGFYREKVIPESDGKSLEAIPGGWVRDKNDVYAGTSALHACDARTFRNLAFHWQIDSQCAYAGVSKIQAADVATFRVINSSYAKDSKHVYSSFKGEVIPDADPASFKLVGGDCQVCARDKNQCYVDNRSVSCDRFEKK